MNSRRPSNDVGKVSTESWELQVQAPTLKQVLDEKVADGTLVNLRCGSLEITGRLREPKDKGEYRCYQIALEDVRYG